MTTKGKIEKCLDDLELKVGETISCQVELWKETDGYCQRTILVGNAEKMFSLENRFISIAREAVFECILIPQNSNR